MFKTDGNEIYLTRGDTLTAEVTIEKDGSAYTPAAGDQIVFALKRAAMNLKRSEFADEQPLVEKVVPNDTLILKLDPADTQELGFGAYVYEISLTNEAGEVDTFIADEPFVLTPEVR